MPDGDKFERGLRGKWWKRAYRLALSNEADNDVVRMLSRAKGQAFGDDVAAALDEITRIVHQSLGNPLFGQSDAIERVGYFIGRLEQVSEAHVGCLGTRLAVDSAKFVYAEMDAQSQPMTLDQVQRQFEGEFTKRVIDYFFFSRIRKSLMDKTGRDSQ
ncbi:MAG: hypothetical protein ACKV2V_09090, partial [Blastocatellia bacterium]